MLRILNSLVTENTLSRRYNHNRASFVRYNLKTKASFHWESETTSQASRRTKCCQSDSYSATQRAFKAAGVALHRPQV